MGAQADLFLFIKLGFSFCFIFAVTSFKRSPPPRDIQGPKDKGKGGRGRGGICPKLFANPCQRSRKKPVLIPSRCTAVEVPHARAARLAVTGGQCTAVTPAVML